jgi:predicted metal-dependent hydrolase
MKHIIQDAEFGPITISQHHLARHIKIHVKPDGMIVLGVPMRMSIRRASSLIDDARETIRRLVLKNQSRANTHQWVNGATIGSSHTLKLLVDSTIKPSEPKSYIEGQKLIVWSHPDTDPYVLKELIDDKAKKLLRTQAKAYLTRRLSFLAETMHCTFERIRFSNAGTRWGSCSSTGTISLNIWLMTVPKELIDYVLIHELSHTKQMNHSPAFWKIVEQFDPYYKDHRRNIKKYSPNN